MGHRVGKDKVQVLEITELSISLQGRESHTLLLPQAPLILPLSRLVATVTPAFKKHQGKSVHVGELLPSVVIWGAPAGLQCLLPSHGLDLNVEKDG